MRIPHVSDFEQPAVFPFFGGLLQLFRQSISDHPVNETHLSDLVHQRTFVLFCFLRNLGQRH